MITTHKKKFLLVLAVIALVTLSCSELMVTNKSRIPVRIVVTMPGGSGSNAKLLDADDSDLFMSDTSGNYSISAIADETYRDKLSDTRERMAKLLLSQKGRDLPDEEFNKYIRDIASINETLAKMTTVSCNGTISDSSRSFVEIDIDYKTSKWSITCGSN